MRKVLFLVLLIVVFAIPSHAGVTCTSETRHGSLTALYIRGGEVYLSIKEQGLGNNPAECLTNDYTCELYLCEVNEDSPIGCKEAPPLGHCVELTLVQCVDGITRQLPYISEISFTSVGPCPAP